MERHALQFMSGEKAKVNYSAFKDELKATLDPTDEVVDAYQFSHHGKLY